MQDTKRFYASKVFWINVVTLITVALTLPDVVAVIPDRYLPAITAVNAVLNLWLRIGTSTPLSRDGAPKATPVILLALLLTGSAACVSARQPATPGQVIDRLSIVSETYASTLARLQETEIGLHRGGVISADDHRIWQRRIERLALAGKAVNEALRQGAGITTVQAQARIVLGLIDDLIAEQIIRLSESQRVTVTLVMESLRGAVLIWSASLSADALGSDIEFDAVRALAEAN